MQSDHGRGRPQYQQGPGPFRPEYQQGPGPFRPPFRPDMWESYSQRAFDASSFLQTQVRPRTARGLDEQKSVAQAASQDAISLPHAGMAKTPAVIRARQLLDRLSHRLAKRRSAGKKERSDVSFADRGSKSEEKLSKANRKSLALAALAEQMADEVERRLADQAAASALMQINMHIDVPPAMSTEVCQTFLPIVLRLKGTEAVRECRDEK